MIDPPQPDEASHRRTPPRWTALTLAALALAVVAGVRGARFLTPECARDGCPELGALGSYTPPASPRIFDRKGNLVAQLPGPKRIVVALDSIPDVVRRGYVAVEDRRFRRHGGVDPISAARAFVKNLRSGRVAQGGSTITMQLARNLFEPDVVRWNPLRRKLAEIRVARLIEEQLGKDEILELYLNQIYLGDGVYGVETASRHYFGKPVARVSTREAALLIGLAKNPEGYDPRQNPAAAARRIETVLGILVREGVVSREEGERARVDRLELSDDGGTPEWGGNAYYLSAVRRELQAIVPDPAKRSGLRIFTGLDRRAQSAAVDALLTQIHAIEEGRLGAFQDPVPDGDLPPMDASPYLQGMLVAMDPASGLVTALVGGRDYHHSQFDRAFQARRQPGSAFKPILYAVALARGARLSDRVSTGPMLVARGAAGGWVPSDRASAPELTVRAALVESSSRIAVRLGESVGVGRVADQARRMGLSSEIPNYPSVFLGAAVVAPVELVAAYAAFGNGGRKVVPHLITRVEGPNGALLYRRGDGRGVRVLDERVAFLVLDVMREIVQVGAGWRSAARALPFPAAGKTGTTNGPNDVWFVGLTEGLVAGVWLGFDQPKPIVPGGSAGTLAAPVWATFMRAANRGRKPATSWAPPKGVVRVAIDVRTGLRATAACGSLGVVREYFVSGTEPSKSCDDVRKPAAAGRGERTSRPLLQKRPTGRDAAGAQEKPPGGRPAADGRAAPSPLDSAGRGGRPSLEGTPRQDSLTGDSTDARRDSLGDRRPRADSGRAPASGVPRDSSPSPPDTALSPPGRQSQPLPPDTSAPRRGGAPPPGRGSAPGAGRAGGGG